MEKGPVILLIVALLSLTVGVLRFFHLGHFGWIQAGYCLLSIPAVLLLLLLADYTLHHARLVLVMVLGIAVLLAVMSPSFCVGLGLGLAGVVVVQSRG